MVSSEHLLDVRLLGNHNHPVDLGLEATIPKVLLSSAQVCLVLELRLTPVVECVEPEDLRVCHVLVKIGVLDGISSIGKGESGCIGAKLLDTVPESERVAG